MPAPPEWLLCMWVTLGLNRGQVCSLTRPCDTPDTSISTTVSHITVNLSLALEEGPSCPAILEGNQSRAQPGRGMGAHLGFPQSLHLPPTPAPPPMADQRAQASELG